MTQQASTSANISGLSDNSAAGLSYCTPIGAIVFLTTEPYKSNFVVRFHAWQCLLLAAAWAAADSIILGLAQISSMVAFMAFGLLPMVALGTLILWLMALLKAINGERLKMPLIGDIAERQARLS